MGRTWFILFLFWFGLRLAQAAEPTRFQLDLIRPELKPGDEGECTIHYFSNTCQTNSTQGQDEITNQVDFFELQGREKILNWDALGDWSKVELTVKRLISGDAMHTNELLSLGMHLIGTSIAGDEFFQTPNAHLPEAAYQLLKRSWPIRPRDFNEFANIKVPESVAVGESWEIPAPMMNSQAIGMLGPAFTNNVKATGYFLGTTNLFGADCFHLQIRVISTNTPDFLKQIFESQLPLKYQCQITLVADVIEPLDATQKSFLNSLFLEMSDSSVMVVDGKIVKSSQGRMMFKLVSQFKFLPQPP